MTAAKDLDIEKLCNYLFWRAEQLQHQNNYDGSFECLYVITCINRGYAWGKDNARMGLVKQGVE